MRYHTACHILSTVVEKDTGSLITGNQITEDKSRIDFNMENFDKEQMNRFESKTNDIISEGVDVDTKFLPREEALQIPSVMKLKN
ncbi:MAG: alanyl-tRNA editing protein AlaX, partial [Candidatus Woesearchaeota archaeon]